MQNVTLYKYTREDGGVTVSPIKPDTDYTTLSRLIADDGMELVNGDTRTVCVDTDTTDGWTEEPVEENQMVMKKNLQIQRSDTHVSSN